MPVPFRFFCLSIIFILLAQHQVTALPYEERRTGWTQYNLTNFMQMQHRIPSDICCIDCACSGGGYRAMIATTALIAALQDIAYDASGPTLYDCVRNMVGLSGSTWAIGHFMARNMSIEDFVSKLRERVVGHDLTEHCFSTLHALADNLENHYENTREIQIVDLWGGLIADRLMGDMGASAHDICLSDFINKYDIQKYPHPIFTTIHPDEIPGCCCCSTTIYDWFEINPNITRQTLSSYYIATRNLGLPPAMPLPKGDRALLPLSSLFGFCGSAFACSFEEIFGFLISNLVAHFKEKKQHTPERGIILDEIISLLESGRLFPGKVPNFTNSDDTDLELIDAGITCNIPLPPLLERRSSIIIICDADASNGTYAGKYPELYKAAAYAHAHNLSFPSLSYPEQCTPPFVRVFKRNEAGKIDPHVPTLIYFHNSVKKSTFDFTYNKEEFNEIFNCMYCAVKKSANIIEEEINEKIAVNMDH